MFYKTLILKLQSENPFNSIMRYLVSISMLILFFFLTAVLSYSNDWTVEKGWKAIKPLKTSRIQVESFLKNPTKNGSRVSYETDEALIHITYSTAPCSDIGRGKYKVDENIVIEYQVVLKKDVKISELKWNENLYKKYNDPEIRQFVNYTNSQDGVTVNTVKLNSGEENVRIINYYPAHEEQNKNLCRRSE